MPSVAAFAAASEVALMSAFEVLFELGFGRVK